MSPAQCDLSTLYGKNPDVRFYWTGTANVAGSSLNKPGNWGSSRQFTSKALRSLRSLRPMVPMIFELFDDG
jgi:hypothetical protein